MADKAGRGPFLTHCLGPETARLLGLPDDMGFYGICWENVVGPAGRGFSPKP